MSSRSPSRPQLPSHTDIHIHPEVERIGGAMRYDARSGTPRLTLVTARVDDNDLRNQQMLIKAAAEIHVIVRVQ